MARPKLVKATRSSERILKNSIIQTLKSKNLGLEKRKDVEAKYRHVYDETRMFDLNENDPFDVLETLKSTMLKQNDCLVESGVNQTVSYDAINVASTTQNSFRAAKGVNAVAEFNMKVFTKRLQALLVNCSRDAGIGVPIGRQASSTQASMPNYQLLFKHLYAVGLLGRRYHRGSSQIVAGYPSDLPPLPPKARRVVTKRPTKSQCTQPTQFDLKSAKENVDESDQRLNYIFDRLQKMELRNPEGVPMLQAAINPGSFSTTIENFFNMSFLARHEMVEIEDAMDEQMATDQPTTGFDITDFDALLKTKVKKDVPDDEEGGGGGNNNESSRASVQSVLSFSTSAFIKLKEALEIDQVALP